MGRGVEVGRGGLGVIWGGATFAVYAMGELVVWQPHARTHKCVRTSTKRSALTSREYVGNLIGIKLVGGPRGPRLGRVVSSVSCFFLSKVIWKVLMQG